MASFAPEDQLNLTIGQDRALAFHLSWTTPNRLTTCTICRPNGWPITHIQLYLLQRVEHLRQIFDKKPLSIGITTIVPSSELNLVLNICGLPENSLDQLMDRGIDWSEACYSGLISCGSPFSLPYATQSNDLSILKHNIGLAISSVKAKCETDPKDLFGLLATRICCLGNFDEYLSQFVRAHVDGFTGPFTQANPLKKDPEAVYDLGVLKSHKALLETWFNDNPMAAAAIYTTSVTGNGWVPNFISEFVVNVFIASSIVDMESLGSYTPCFSRINTQVHELMEKLMEPPK